jgi:NAD+ kinase
MKIGLYKRIIEEEYVPLWKQLIGTFEAHHVEVTVLEDGDSLRDIHFVVSVGGDGTLLSVVHTIGSSGIPVVGLNFGHLGFLTTAGRDRLEEFVAAVVAGNYTIEERTLLDVLYRPADGSPEVSSYALNEVYVHRAEHPSLLKTAVFVDEEFVANYVSDGLIVATPTGSTAYSLSCGGPILTPTSGCFAITPIAAHTLTLRPMIVPDSVSIRLMLQSRDEKFCLGMDSRSLLLPGQSVIMLRRAPFTLKLVRMQGQSFFTAIHEKLSWGK